MVISHENLPFDVLSAEEAAAGFSAIGSEARLGLLVALVRVGEAGLSVGDIQTRTGMPASTLAHHLRILTAAGLVEQERSGRTVTSRAAFDHIRGLANYILNECCADVADCCSDADGCCSEVEAGETVAA